MNFKFKSVFCKSENRKTELFSTKEEADRYISFRQSTMSDGNIQLRSVYCPLCAGWHQGEYENNSEEYSSGQNNILFSLENLVSELKSSFEPEMWQIWQPRLEESRVWVAQLEENDALKDLLVEAKRQLVHYNAIVQNMARKHQRKTGMVRNRLNRIKADMNVWMSKLKPEKCQALVGNMNELMQTEDYQMMAEEERKEWDWLYYNLEDDEFMRIVSQVATMLKTVRVGGAILPTEQLKLVYEGISSKMNGEGMQSMHPLLLHPIQREMNQIQKQLNFRGTDYIDPNTGLDRVTVTLLKQIEYCNRKFEEAEQALAEEDKLEALHVLQQVDEHIRHLPLCKNKIMIIERMVSLARQFV